MDHAAMLETSPLPLKPSFGNSVRSYISYQLIGSHTFSE